MGPKVAAMTSTDLVQAFDARLAIYDLDDRAQRIIAEIWPIIAPHLERAVEENIAATIKMAFVGTIVAQNTDLLKNLELAHYRALLVGKPDRHYAELCRDTVEQEAAIGLDARMRSIAGSFVLKAALDALARKYRFSPARLVECTKIISRVICFDIASAITLHLEAAELRRRNRREKIDAAIADLGTAIDEALDAIENTSLSLATTCTNMSGLADETLNRMTIAAAAANETAQRVKLTGDATERLSASINHIGEEASLGLEMTKAASGDTQRTQQAVLSLSNAAEQIGAIVGIISTIAAQTNLLALNATIEAARAGDMGKGFGIVASEVKALAKQTSDATAKISHQVAAIQDSTRKSVGEISSIAKVIEQLTASATVIASAVEEQATTTRDIATSMQTASRYTASASTEISSVENAAGRNAVAFNEIGNLSAQMSSRAQELKSKVVTFFNRVRAA